MRPLPLEWRPVTVDHIKKMKKTSLELMTHLPVCWDCSWTTGYDHILGRFRSIAKDRTFKTFMKSVNDEESEIIDSLKSLGEGVTMSVEHIKSLERLTVLFYIGKRKEF